MKERLKGIWKIITGIGGLLVVVLFLMALFGAFDDEAEEIGNAEVFRGNDTKSVFSGESMVGEKEDSDGQAVETETSEDNSAAAGSVSITNQNNTDIDAVLPGDSDYDKYLHVGRTYKLRNNVDMEILDAGFGFGIVYVLVEMTNNSEQDVYFDQSCATLYVDDYEVPDGMVAQSAIDNGYVFVSGDTSYLTAASANAGGRKGSLVFVADIPDTITETSEVEFEILGGVFRINPLVTGRAKENIEAMYGANPSAADEKGAYGSEGYGGIVYGKYSCSPNVTGGENIAYVDFATDGDGGEYVDFIMIDSYEADDEGMPNSFEGDIVENGNSYSATNTLGMTISITFVEGGMNVEVLSGDGMEIFAGYYKLDEALDLNSVS